MKEYSERLLAVETVLRKRKSKVENTYKGVNLDSLSDEELKRLHAEAFAETCPGQNADLEHLTAHELSALYLETVSADDPIRR